MSTKIHHLDPLPGTRELFMLLDIIKDPKKYKKLMGEIEERRDELNEKMELVCKAEEIETLQSNAARAVNEAHTMLANAKEEASKIKHNAEEKLAKKERDLKDGERILAEKQKEFGLYTSDKNNELRSFKNVLDEREADLTKRETEASSLSERAEKAINEINRKRTIIENTAREIGG